jgi:hypothetical protein
MITHVRDGLHKKYNWEDQGEGWQWDCVAIQFDLMGEEETFALFACRDSNNNVQRVRAVPLMFGIA